MTWTDLVSTAGGWGAAAFLVAEFLRRLIKGEFVLKREYDLVVAAADKATTEAKQAVDKQGEASKQTIATQAEFIKTQEALLKELRKDGGSHD